jgi:hypothetical protein
LIKLHLNNKEAQQQNGSKEEGQEEGNKEEISFFVWGSIPPLIFLKSFLFFLNFFFSSKILS